MKIIIPEAMYEGGVDALRKKFEVVYDPTLIDRPAEFLRLVPEANALIVRKGTQVNVPLLNLAPKLRAVARLGVGLDNIDVAACKTRNIAVIPATNANTQSVAEHVIAAAILLLRPSFLSSVETIRGDWPRLRHFQDRELGGKTLGLVGFGNIGRCTARLARVFGVRVIAHDPLLADTAPVWNEFSVVPRTFEQLLAESDLVSIHVPLSPATRDLIDDRRIAQMKRGAMLINAARGGIVNEAALVRGLKSGQLGGAHLDVFDPEPLPPGSILEGAPNLILTPHTAGITQEAEMRTGELIAAKVADFFAQ